MQLISHKALRRAGYASVALIALLGGPIASFGQDQAAAPSSTAPDNSARNQKHKTTADQQGMNDSDRMVTKKIRRAIVADKSLSTYAHNVKIITKDGSVTLKGPVHSDEEKQAVAAKAAEVAGQDKVTNDLTVKQ